MFARILIGVSLIAIVATSNAQVFKEDFSKGLTSDRWKVSTWTAPRHSSINIANFSASNVEVINGILRLRLSQTRNFDGSISSTGGELMTIRQFGYGTYTLVMKASANQADEAVSGSVTGAGPYFSLSETEINIEMEGLKERSHLTQLTTWVNENTSEKSQVTLNGLPHSDFFTYKIVWEPTIVRFFRNDELIATHTKIVPSKPAPFLLNHWGTNDLKWGGYATPGAIRYVYVKSFMFEPLDLKKL